MHQIGLIVYPGFQVLGLAMCAAFELANNAVDEPLYRIALLSETGGLVQTSAGFAVQTEAFDPRSFDTLLVMGDNLIRPTTSRLLQFGVHIISTRTRSLVGARLRAMVVNDNACVQDKRGALEAIASKPAPTVWRSHYFDWNPVPCRSWLAGDGR
jgi:transcriptional regulator GlxA family with amidase domain